MDSITVVIPAQPYLYDKYIGWDNITNLSKPCYLEEALTKAGYTDNKVTGDGITVINNKTYKPAEPFNGNVVKAKIEHESISVTLIPIE